MATCDANRIDKKRPVLHINYIYIFHSRNLPPNESRDDLEWF